MSLSLDSTPPVVSRQLRLPGRSVQLNESQNISKLATTVLLGRDLMPTIASSLSLKEIGVFATVSTQTKDQVPSIVEQLKNRSSLTLKEAAAYRKMAKSRFKDWQSFFEACPKLKLLDLGKNSLMTLRAMRIFSKCRFTIEIGGCSKLTEKELPALKKLCPGVTFQRARAKPSLPPAPGRLESLFNWFFQSQPHLFPHETPGL